MDAPDTLHSRSVVPVAIDVHVVPLKRSIVPLLPVAYKSNSLGPQSDVSAGVTPGCSVDHAN